MRSRTALGRSLVVCGLLLWAGCGSTSDKGAADTTGQQDATDVATLDNGQPSDTVPDTGQDDTLPPGDLVIPDSTTDVLTDLSGDVPSLDVTDVEDAADVPTPDLQTDETGDTTIPPGQVGPEGGVVEGPAGARLTIPAGALAEVVQFTMVQVTEPHSGEFSVLSPAIDIGPSGTLFLMDATVEFDLDALPGTGDVQLYMAAGQGQPWEALPSSIVGSKVSAQVSHLSWYQVGLTDKTDCEQLCDFLIPCMVSECGLVEPALSQGIAECPGMCESELPANELAVLLATQECADLIKALVPSNTELIDMCDIQPDPCSESVGKLASCMLTDCSNSAPYLAGYEQLQLYQCSQNPDPFSQLALLTCAQFIGYVTENDSSYAALCTVGPAVDTTGCNQLVGAFTTCTPPAGTMWALLTPEVFAWYVCGLGAIGTTAASCALDNVGDCASFYGCFPS